MNSQRYSPENRKKNFLIQAIATSAIFAIWTLLAVTFLVITGCGEKDMAESVLREDTAAIASENAIHTLGAMKTPVMAAPQAPGVGAPSVTSVAYFKDWQRTKPITEASAGDTVYIQIVFSKKMKVVAADDKTARPIIYYKEDKSRTRFRIAPLGARGKDFVHGDIKPVKTSATFLGKYTVQEDIATFTIAVGKQAPTCRAHPWECPTHTKRICRSVSRTPRRLR